jgi:hypothetical protein
MSYYRSIQSKSIYGIKKTSTCEPADTCLTEILLKTFYNTIDKLQDVIGQFFPSVNSQSTIITKMRAYAFMNDYTYVRFVWINKNQNKKFDPTILSLRYEILDIYLQHNLTSWKTDPLVNNLINTVQ